MESKTNLHNKAGYPDRLQGGHKPAASLPASVKQAIEQLTINPAWRGFLMLLVLVLAALTALAPIFPQRVDPASAPLEAFSGERAMAHLPVIAREPHPSGSPAQALVSDYLFQQLSGMGLQPEIQQASGAENVVARLYGSDPTGAIVVLAHYDLSRLSPGAADNGSGAAVLFEVMRALASGPVLRNDVIALFDDSEELPDAFTGTKAFVREHPWMEDVRVAISLDTASRGFVAICEIGPENGWMVDVLDRAYNGGAWYSMSGGGNYDSTPFRNAGVQVLALEDNYPFKEKETAQDRLEVVKPALVQQMGQQTLAITRELGALELGNPRGEQETYFSLPVLGFFHYPMTWVVPLAVASGILLILALGMSLRRRYTSWRGLGVALVSILVTAALAALGTNALWSRLPELMKWDIGQWPEWPEVIPPDGEILFAVSGMLVLGLAIVVYLLARRWSSQADFSLIGLLPFFILALAFAIGVPQAAFVPTWPVLIASLCWVLAAAGRKSASWAVDLAALVAVVPLILFFMPTLVGTFMSDGTKSVAILAAVWALLLGAVLPVVDGILVKVSKGKRIMQEIVENY